MLIGSEPVRLAIIAYILKLPFAALVIILIAGQVTIKSNQIYTHCSDRVLTCREAPPEKTPSPARSFSGGAEHFFTLSVGASTYLSEGARARRSLRPRRSGPCNR